MKIDSILLTIDGSLNSRHAADFAFDLSNKANAQLQAQHVVDVKGAWEFIGHNYPGFVGSQAYITAHQGLCNSLLELAELLANRYRQDASAHGIPGAELIVDHGDPVVEICRRAKKHDIVVIGHQKHEARAQEQLRRQFARWSIAESLAHMCERPLLIVQEARLLPQAVTILVFYDHVNGNYINNALSFAKSLAAKPRLVCLGSSVHEESPSSFIEDLREANPTLADVPIELKALPARLDLSGDVAYLSGLDLKCDQWKDGLIVMPTRMSAGKRITVEDSSAALLVRFLDMPMVLLWPEEYNPAEKETAGAVHAAKNPEAARK